MPNFSIDADPQQQEAASPLVLVVRSFLRYTVGSALIALDAWFSCGTRTHSYWRSAVHSFLSALGLVVGLLPGSLCAQSEPVKLPNFKTFYTFTDVNYRNDISFAPVEGEMRGRLQIAGDRCYVDDTFPVSDEGDNLVIRVPRMTARLPKDEEFCDRPQIVSMPKAKESLGRRGTLQAPARKSGDRSFTGFFPF